MVLLSLLGTLAYAQGETDAETAQSNTTYDQLLELTQLTLNEEAVKIDYKIPYGGMVEFRLYRPLKSGRNLLVWQTQHVREPGDHDLRLKKKMLPNGPYHYTFHYKGADMSGEFTVSGGKAMAPKEADAPNEEDTSGSEDIYEEYDFDPDWFDQ